MKGNEREGAGVGKGAGAGAGALESRSATIGGMAHHRGGPPEQERSRVKNDVFANENERTRRAQEITIVISNNENLRSNEGP